MQQPVENNVAKLRVDSAAARSAFIEAVAIHGHGSRQAADARRDLERLLKRFDALIATYSSTSPATWNM